MTTRDVDFEIDIDGLITAINVGAREGLAAGANLVVKDARARAPEQTGTLVNSIQAQPPEGDLMSGEITAIVSAGAPYATYVEFGTGIHGPRGQRIWIEPKNRKALRWVGPGGEYRFSKGHYIDGMKPQPFLVPAAEENAEAVAEVVGDAIENAIDKLGD